MILNRITLSFFLLICSFSLSAQGFLELVDFPDQDTFRQNETHTLFDPVADQESARQSVSEAVSHAVFFNINNAVRQQILSSSSAMLVLSVPFEHETADLFLIEAPVLSEGASFFTATDRLTPRDFDAMKLYWGVVDGFPGSFVSVAVSNDCVMGFITVNEQDYTLGKMENSEVHMLYRNNDMLVNSGLGCHVDELMGEVEDTQHHPQQHGGSRDASNCVNMYVEVDYDIYQDKETVEETTSYIMGLFNQVGILYANELINFSVQELLVWDEPSPYTGPSTINYLNQFLANVGNSFNGDLAHLVGYEGGGGVAYLSRLCASSDRGAYSGINSSYQNVPTYSWSVMVVTHEIGHNLGSRHTHNCIWNGAGNDAIDGCGPQAGYSEGCDGPIPSAGTIMSYCHLISGVGISLTEGFGPQPGDLVRDNVYNASCLGDCVTLEDCQNPFALEISNVTSNSVQLSWNQSGPATSWDIEYGIAGFTPTGTPTITGASNPETISGLSSATNYDFYVRAVCDGTSEVSGWTARNHLLHSVIHCF